MPLARTLASEGQAAAVAQYRRLQETQPEAYDTRPSRFADAVWGAIEVHRPDAVRPLLELWITLQPEASEEHEMLGWADFVVGDRERAAASLRRAIELDEETRTPSSYRAPGLKTIRERTRIEIRHLRSFADRLCWCLWRPGSKVGYDRQRV